MSSYTAVKERFLADTTFGAAGASPALARALERIGWRSVREPSPAELASYLVDVLDDCVRGHHDVVALTHAIATVLRDAGPMLDGGLPPVEAYHDAAEELLRHYVNDDGTMPSDPLS